MEGIVPIHQVLLLHIVATELDQYNTFINKTQQSFLLKSSH